MVASFKKLEAVFLFGRTKVGALFLIFPPEYHDSVYTTANGNPVTSSSVIGLYNSESFNLPRVICQRYPYAKWLENNSKHINDFKTKEKVSTTIKHPLQQRQIAFGWTQEDEHLILKAMVQNSKEPIGSMGADIPLAVLSSLAQHISNYFNRS